MKTEKYIVEIEMPEGDDVSSLWVEDVLQTDADVEDEGRWKVTVKEHWKPNEELLDNLNNAANGGIYKVSLLEELYEQLKEIGG